MPSNPNPLRQRGIAILRFDSVYQNPSLTRRVGIIDCVFVPFTIRDHEMRNFKTDASGCDGSPCFAPINLPEALNITTPKQTLRGEVAGTRFRSASGR